MTCCFFGHKDTPSDVAQRLMPMLEGLISEGVNTFLVGHQGNFDRMALYSLRELKKKYPHIAYYVVLAYLPGQSTDYEQYAPEETLYPEGLECVHPRYAISWRNNYLVRESDIVVTYITHPWGGAAQFAQKAQKQGKRMVALK